MFVLQEVRSAVACALVLALGHAHAQSAAASLVDDGHGMGSLEQIVVSATREGAALAETPASIGVIDAADVRLVGPAHPQQLLGQVPGVAIAVTNGEGHTTAIRQPFSTSPLYLYLEDGVPIRATGFFNHNALYEVDLPQAGGIEVTRGPGSALYGSDAVGGVINTLTQAPADMSGFDASVEAGSFGWRRALLDGDTGPGAFGALHGALNVTHTDGWRDATAYDRQAVNARWDAAWNDRTRIKTVVAGGRIDQRTGANSPLIYDAYRKNPTQNNLPIAYRKVDAVRMFVDVERQFGDGLLALTPYVRDNKMELLASFALSFDPTVYTTANRSIGVLAKWRQEFPAAMRARLIGGVDVDYSPGWREENRLALTVSGAGASRVYSAYTLGARVYDYDVIYQSVSPYLHGELSPTERLRLTAGARFDSLRYRLDNRLSGATQSAAAYYGQAPSGEVGFSHITPKIGATYALNDDMSLYTSYNSGFRAPSESQLFRPSVASTATDATNKALLALKLKPILAAQAEFGWRGAFEHWSADVVAYQLTKRDDLVNRRDLATNVSTSVNAGRTSHRGVEIGAGVQLAAVWRIDAALSSARHKYVEWTTSGADLSGNEMEAAPRVFGNARLTWSPDTRASAQLEWIRVGEYWLEASNSANYPKYPGHDLLNARVRWRLGRSVGLFARAYNLADKRYADSAQVSSNTAVYSPGSPRTYYAGIDAQWGGGER